MADDLYPVLKPVGEDALLVEFEPTISLEVNRRVRQLAFALEQAALPGVGEIIPAYRSLMVYFDTEQLNLNNLQTAVVGCEREAQAVALPAPRLFRIPTIYGGTHGPDLLDVAKTIGKSTDDVIHLFSTEQFPVYCLGFLCSLAYLGGVPQQLNLPRLATPRTHIPAGSVGIAGGQAVVLPIDMPSGFHYIGRTVVSMYDPARMPPTPIRPGDLAECPAVSEEEAKQWSDRWLGDCLVGSDQNY